MDLKTLGNVPYESPKPKHRSWVSSLSRKERKDRKGIFVFQSNAFYGTGRNLNRFHLCGENRLAKTPSEIIKSV